MYRDLGRVDGQILPCTIPGALVDNRERQKGIAANLQRDAGRTFVMYGDLVPASEDLSGKRARDREANSPSQQPLQHVDPSERAVLVCCQGIDCCQPFDMGKVGATELLKKSPVLLAGLIFCTFLHGSRDDLPDPTQAR
ncbi:MAG: hypothetical protein ACK5MT_18330 [Actinomycetales bacterium]